MTKSTQEPQYERCLEVKDRNGLTKLGLMSNQVWYDDPKRLVFLLSRYKFVAKMFSGLQRVLEVGCADAFGTRVVRQEVPHITAIDFDPLFIEDAKMHLSDAWSFSCQLHNILRSPVKGSFDGAYALDVLEHVPRRQERRFMGNIVRSLNSDGILILGSPSIQSQRYASPVSKAGHVNCKDAAGLKKLASVWFKHVFIFSMNDEVVHTGYYPMAQYLLALCCGKKVRPRVGR